MTYDGLFSARQVVSSKRIQDSRCGCRWRLGRYISAARIATIDVPGMGKGEVNPIAALLVMRWAVNGIFIFLVRHYGAHCLFRETVEIIRNDCCLHARNMKCM